MRTNIVWRVTLLAFVALLAFQAFGLFYSYRLKKEDIETNINTLMRGSVEKEVMDRRKKSDIKEEGQVIDEKTFKEDTTYRNRKTFKLNEQEAFEAGFFQQLLNSFGFPFNLLSLDSIFQSELQKENLLDSYALFYRDSTSVIIDQIDNLSQQELKKAFKTDSLLIVNGNRVQAFVVISPPTVYKRMFGLLIASALVLILLFFCIGYLTKTIFTQDKLNTLKNDFINSFVHNIKTPLSTLKMILIKFVKGELDSYPEKKEKFGKTGMAQLENLLLLADQILTVTKLEEGQSMLNRSDTDLNEMIKELKDKYSVSNDKLVTISTSVNISSDLIISIDRTLIKEAVSNLIDNAIKYSGNAVRIAVDCETIENTLRIRVIDDGYGIAQKNHLSIFEKFERGDAFKRKEAKGFGLGLNYVKRVAEAHGGFVTLFSHIGEGSEFTLLLPIEDRKTVRTQDRKTIIHNS